MALIELHELFTGRVLFGHDAENNSTRLTLEAGVQARADLLGANLQETDLRGANLQETDLRGANLRGADLRGANLQETDLRGANLQETDLRGADLQGVDLQGADFQETDLRGANLRGANLRGADLGRANLRGADLLGVILPTGETWDAYISEVVPALCQAGGQPLTHVMTAWACHSWNNCPMALAFGVQTLDDIPLLYKPRVEQFVQLFDAGLIPCPTVHDQPEGGMQDDR